MTVGESHDVSNGTGDEAKAEAVDIDGNLVDVSDARDMIEKLKKDHALVMEMKQENSLLREKISGLVRNNEKMVDLVKKVDEKERKAFPMPQERMIYSFQAGGMVKKGQLERDRLDLHRKKLTLQEINDQLNEIVAMLERSGKAGKAK
jgi:hypothetical protein